MFDKKKYKLFPKEQVVRHGKTYTLHRIQALRDIPLHGVKAGDMGGYVKSRKTLSHEDSCWIGGNAIVTAKFSEGGVSGDALVTDDAFVMGNVCGKSKIYGNSRVAGYFGGHCDISGNVNIESCHFDGRITLKDNVKFKQGSVSATSGKGVVFSGDVIINCPSLAVENTTMYRHFITLSAGELIEISGKVRLDTVFIIGNCKLDGEFHLENVSFKGDNTVFGSPDIKPDTKFSGSNTITGTSVIPPGSHVHGVVMSSGVLDYTSPGFSDKSVKNFSDESVSSSVPKVESNEYVDLIAEIVEEYESYTTDIVKLIKFPGMVDTSISEVNDFVIKLRSAKRAVKSSDPERIKEVAKALEVSFVNAENRVQTLVVSHLDENKKKSLKTAEQMFKLACDEASPEPEKRLGFKAGIRALEGIVLVSDVAKENMKARVGILELEA